MAIERWDPFREAVSLRDAMNTLLQESFVRPGGLSAPNGQATLPLDVSETEEAFVVKASLPGIRTPYEEPSVIRRIPSTKASESSSGCGRLKRSSTLRDQCAGAGRVPATAPTRKPSAASPRQAATTDLVSPSVTRMRAPSMGTAEVWRVATTPYTQRSRFCDGSPGTRTQNQRINLPHRLSPATRLSGLAVWTISSPSTRR